MELITRGAMLGIQCAEMYGETDPTVIEHYTRCVSAVARLEAEQRLKRSAPPGLQPKAEDYPFNTLDALSDLAVAKVSELRRVNGRSA